MSIEKEFVFNHVFKNVSSMKDGAFHFSPVVEHFGVPWKIGGQYKEDHFGLYLYCNQEKKDKEWTIEIWRKMSLKAVGGKSHSFVDNVSYKNTDKFSAWGWVKFIKWEEMMKDYVANDTLTAEVHVKIKKMSGIDLRNFSESKKHLSDVVLVVENRSSMFQN